MLSLLRHNFFYKIKYDLKGQLRSQTMTFLIIYLKIHFSSVYVIERLKKQIPLNIMKEQSMTYTKTTFFLF